jgi:hypothetical protein
MCTCCRRRGRTSVGGERPRGQRRNPLRPRFQQLARSKPKAHRSLGGGSECRHLSRLAEAKARCDMMEQSDARECHWPPAAGRVRCSTRWATGWEAQPPRPASSPVRGRWSSWPSAACPGCPRASARGATSAPPRRMALVSWRYGKSSSGRAFSVPVRPQHLRRRNQYRIDRPKPKVPQQIYDELHEAKSTT